MEKETELRKADGGLSCPKLVWVVMKIDHMAHVTVYAVCSRIEYAEYMVQNLKDDTFVNHALCFQIPFFGTYGMPGQQNT